MWIKFMDQLARYLTTARDAGVPRDQIDRYLMAGVVLNPAQLRAAAAARECDHPDGPTMVGYGGARGGGKSHFVLAQMGADDCQRMPGLKCLWLRKVGKGAKESLEDLRPRVLSRIQHRYNQTSGVITFKNGSRILSGHFKNESDVDAYLGLEYDVIAIEEDTTLSVAKKRMIRTCLRTSKPNWRPRLYRTTNPGGVSHADFKKTFVEPFKRGQETTSRFIPATFRDNPYLNPDYVQQLDQLVGWQKRAWRDGDWDVAAGMYFSNWSDATHVVAPFDVPEHWRVWAALDYGFTHPTAMYVFAEDGDGMVYVVGEHVRQKALPKTHAHAYFSLLSRLKIAPQRIRTFVAGADVFAQRGDSEARTIADQYADYGITLERADIDRITGASELLHRLGDPESGIDPSLKIFNTCPVLIETIPAMVHDPLRPEDVDKVDADEDGVGGDDPYDGCRYGLMVASKRRGWLSRMDELANVVSG